MADLKHFINKFITSFSETKEQRKQEKLNLENKIAQEENRIEQLEKQLNTHNFEEFLM